MNNRQKNKMNRNIFRLTVCSFDKEMVKMPHGFFHKCRMELREAKEKYIQYAHMEHIGIWSPCGDKTEKYPNRFRLKIWIKTSYKG